MTTAVIPSERSSLVIPSERSSLVIPSERSSLVIPSERSESRDLHPTVIPSERSESRDLHLTRSKLLELSDCRATTARPSLAASRRSATFGE
jgi:hypothetical protein